MAPLAADPVSSGEEALAAQRRAVFLAEAGQVLAGSLEYEETFAVLAKLIVPGLADYFAIDLLQEDGTPRLVTLAHRDPEQEPVVREMRGRFTFHRDAEFGIAKAIRTGEPDYCERLTPEQVARVRRVYGESIRPEDLALTSYMVVPLAARGRILGALSLIGLEDRAFTAADLQLAIELGQRVASALDHAALYQVAQQARQEAERANVAKDRFLAMLSHELRTPLTPVLATALEIEEDPGLPAQFLPMIRMIRRNVELESRLIDDLLDLTRVSKGKIRLRLERVDVHDLLRSTLEICAGDLAAQNLRVVEKFTARRASLQADPARLQQVFWNLIKNAVKFTPAGGELRLQTSDEERKLRLEVRDTGQGIEPELLPRIFDAFEQGEGPRAGGLGLGLAIGKALVEMHGGRIHAESEGVGKGAVFIVELPLPDEEIATPTEANEGGWPANWRPLRLLLVDDHADTNSALTRLLGRRGYEVRGAADLASALAIAGVFRFDVLISDMGLPDGDGIELLRRLRAIRGPVRAVAVSGFGMEEDVRRSREAGFAEHLVKPIDLHRLDTVLQEVAARKPS